MKIIIIGGGLTGLVAAYKLSRNPENKVIVYEKNKKPGGMLKSYNINNYDIEEYYHHIFLSDIETLTLLQELALHNKVKWRLVKNGYYIENKIYPLNTPLDFLKLPSFNLKDLARFVFLIIKIKRVVNFKPLDDVAAKKWVVNNSTVSVWENFFIPLLKSKFGKNLSNISAAWLIKRIQLRSHRKWRGEILGYLDDGFIQLVEKIKDQILKNNGEINFNAAVIEIIHRDNKVEGIKLADGKYIEADKIIFSGSEYNLKKISSGVLNNTKFTPPKYQGSICVLLGLKEKLMNDIYWLNIKDDDIPFRALIEHTNFISVEKYKNEHLVYLTYYFQDTGDGFVKMEDSKLMTAYFNGLKKIFPRFDKNLVNWWRIKKEFPTAPIYETGYFDKILPYNTKVKDLYIAGINSINNYPERSINGSIKTGIEVANSALSPNLNNSQKYSL